MTGSQKQREAVGTERGRSVITHARCWSAHYSVINAESSVTVKCPVERSTVQHVIKDRVLDAQSHPARSRQTDGRDRVIRVTSAE